MSIEVVDQEEFNKQRQRYVRAMHAMQSGVAARMTIDPSECIPKHLRVGVNSVLVDVSAVARLLMDKGIFTELEYLTAPPAGAGAGADSAETAHSRGGDVMARYAEGTTVSVINSRMEVEKIILKYAGQGAEFAYMQREGFADIVFVAHNRRVRFTLPIPTMDEAKKGAKGKRDWGDVTDLGRRQAWVERESMRRWRCLVLAIKAKLEVVESGIATFEEEFAANIVLPNGKTVGELVVPAIACAYESHGGMLMLAPVPGGSVDAS